MITRKIQLLILIPVLITSCEHVKLVENQFMVDDFVVEKSLPYFDRFYASSDVISLNTPAVCDDQGIDMVLYSGIKEYNPVILSFQGLRYLNGYKITLDSSYLNRAELFADKLLEIGIFKEDALFFPYNFDFALHEGDDLMKDPWYSGMAQGTVLSFFSYFYDITGQKKYLDRCEEVFRSIIITQPGHIDNRTFCVSRIDSLSYLWIEEYPFSPSTSALNGFIFAIIGLHDYYCINPDNKLLYKYLTGTLKTIKDNILLYRNPGNYSYYCLKHKCTYSNYHQYHMQQLNYLYLITNEIDFKDAATLFSIDRPN